MKIRLFTLLAVFSVASALAEAPDYTAADAAKHIGETATVTDKVEGVHQAKGGNIFINLGGAHPNAPFTAFIPSTSAEKFPDFKGLDGATISVSGKITAHNEKPEIVVRTPDQIIVKGAGTGKPEGDTASSGAAESPSPSPAVP